MSLDELFAGRNLDIPMVLAHLKAKADELGLPFGPRRMTFNSRRAAELGKWAESSGRGDEYHLAVFKAYFVDGLNIARISVLEKLAESVGLSPVEARLVIEEKRMSAEVDRDWALSRSAGISAVPTFSFQDRYLVGAQPYEKMKKLFEVDGQAGVSGLIT